MNDRPSRVVWGLLGAVAGFLMAAAMFRGPGPLIRGGMPDIGMPEMFFVLPLVFITLWIVLVAGAIRWLFNPRARQPGRLADLPADFDDWHRRAHAQMDREAAAGTGGTRS